MIYLRFSTAWGAPLSDNPEGAVCNSYPYAYSSLAIAAFPQFFPQRSVESLVFVFRTIAGAIHFSTSPTTSSKHSITYLFTRGIREAKTRTEV